MKIGYPCSNLSLRAKTASTFRLASYSEERLTEAIAANLNGLRQVIEYNREHGILLFRITSDLIPFASHAVNTFDWREVFAGEFALVGATLREYGMRVSMHPGQYVLLNSPKPEVVAASVKELAYHADVLDLMGMGSECKIQIHVGGIYEDKELAMRRWRENYALVPETVRRRLVIENDERSYCLTDCLKLSEATGVPVLFDVFHHSIFNDGEPVPKALHAVAATWKEGDGIPQVDYSSQNAEKQRGAHTLHIEIEDFRHFLSECPIDCDIMLEIKDKETSALEALDVVRELGRLDS